MSIPLSTTLPAVVYVPTSDDASAPDARPALARDLDGSAELFCFTSPDLLRHFHGTSTPWRRMSRAQVAALIKAEGVARCHLDPRPPADPRPTAVPEQRLSALAPPPD